MIQLNGVDFNNQAPLDIALEMMNRINLYCANNGIKNRDGEIVKLEANDASIPWHILLAQGYEDSVLQALMIGVAANLSFVECSDTKLLEWARIMKVVRKKASNTTIIVSIEAGPDGAVFINDTDSCSIRSGNSSLVFRPVKEYTIEPGSVMSIVFISDITGPFDIPQDAIESFDKPKDNVVSIHSAPSIPGRREETIQEMRWRMQTGNLHSGDVDSAMNAIGQLPGVSYCNIMVNPGNTSTLTVNGIEIPPRYAALFVQGYSENIAAEYAKYMTMNTAVADEVLQPGRTITQDYITRAGQHIPIHFLQPSIQDVVIRVYTELNIAHSDVLRLEDVILSMNGLYGIGKQITSQDIIRTLGQGNLEFNCIAALISNDLIHWEPASHIDGGSIMRIIRSNIEVVQWIP